MFDGLFEGCQLEDSMSFIQIVVAEDDATPSGASIRNKSNFDILSTLWSAKGGGRIIALRTDKKLGAKSDAAIVARLLRNEVMRLVDECRREVPDFVLVEGVSLYQAAAALAHAVPGLPLIVDMHNIESTLQMQIESQRFPRLLHNIASIFFVRHRRACLNVERQIVRIAKQVWVCSSTDKSMAEELFGAIPISVVPNPIPDWARAGVFEKDPGSTDVLFVGHLGYSPNRNAVKFLCTEVMPKLRRVVPNAQLHVCGRRPRRKVTALLRSTGHRYSPNAQDLTQAYATAAAVAIPLRAGGGTRLKVLEAMAVGCPVIASGKAVEGLGLLPQVHYKAAETAAEFASEIAQVLASRSVAEQMAQRAQQYTSEHYGQDARLERVRTALADGKFLDGSET